MSSEIRKIFAALLLFTIVSWILLLSYASQLIFQIPNGTYLGVIASSIFSGLIYLVYRRQNRILEYQSEIMRGDHVPIFGVEQDDFGITGEKPEYDEDSEQVITEGEQSAWSWFRISNLGNEIGEDIHVRVLLRYDTPVDDLGDTYRGLRQPLDNLDLISQTNRGKGAVLPPDTEPVFMRTNLSVKRIDEEGNVEHVAFTSAIRKLVEEKSIVTDVGFVLEYKNTFGQAFSMRIDPAYRLVPDDFTGSFDDWDSAATEYSIYELIDAVDWTRPEDRKTSLPRRW